MTEQASDIRFGFQYDCKVVAPDGTVLAEWTSTNLIPQVGVNHIAGMLRGTTAPISPWYLGIFEGNFVPQMSTTAADLPTTAAECVAYAETERPIWDNSYDGLQVISSYNSRATFTMTAAKRLYGAFLVSDPAKGGNGGTLLSIARFASPYDLVLGATFSLGARIVLVP